MKTKALFITLFCAFQTLAFTSIFATDIKLGEYPFPITTASFSAIEVAANVQMNDLTYTNNLTYDYNTVNGYFRPYKWPEGAKATDTYLEFTLVPQNSANVTVGSLQIIHKPNTALLGPSKISLSYSTDNGANFTPVAEKIIMNRTVFNTDVFTFDGLSTNQPIIFRLYAYESLYGTVTQKDLWIIDNIELFGSVQGGLISSIVELNNNHEIKFYYSDSKLHISNVHEGTKLTVFNLSGKIIRELTVDVDQNIELKNAGSAIVIKLTSENSHKTVKVINK